MKNKCIPKCIQREYIRFTGNNYNDVLEFGKGEKFTYNEKTKWLCYERFKIDEGEYIVKNPKSIYLPEFEVMCEAEFKAIYLKVLS